MTRASSAVTMAMLAGLLVIPHGNDKQPKVQPGPSEPDWMVILDRVYHLRMTEDLLNPVTTTPDKARALFRKAGPGPVHFEPVLALGLEVPIHGGFYLKTEEPELWSYQAKSTARDIETGVGLVPPLKAGSTTAFDPKGEVFGLWVGNDQFKDRVYTEPGRVVRQSSRLAAQPYKVMIYPYVDPGTRKPVPSSYLIGWEYSTNDDFQDVVTRIDNVKLVD